MVAALGMEWTTELFVNLELQARHSLDEREEPHSHTWEIEVGLQGELREGRIVSLPEAHRIFSDVLRPLRDTYLNGNPELDEASRRFPTCENLCVYLAEAFENALVKAGLLHISITDLRVGVREADGVRLGYARLSRANPAPEKSLRLAGDRSPK